MNGGGRTDALTCAVDIYATILDALDVKDNPAPHGKSVLPVLSGEGRGRDFTYWGTFGAGICCTDGDYVLLQGPDGEAPLYSYSAMMQSPCPEAQSGKYIHGVDCPVWKIPLSGRFSFPSIMYKKDDPLFAEKNIINEHSEIAERLRKRLRDQLTQDGCPPEQFDRLGL
jgi:hypothetical protein